MGRKPARLEIRCGADTKDEFRRVAAEIDPDADHEEVIELFLEDYRRRSDYWRNRYEEGGFEW